jgi:hypothetical protein
MNKHRLRTPLKQWAYGLLALGFVGVNADAASDMDKLVDRRAPLVIDFLGGTYLPGPKAIIVSGAFGLVGKLTINGDAATLEKVPGVPNVDFTAMHKLSDTEVLLGSAKGKIFLYDGSKVTEVASLSEFEEPVLDIVTASSGAWAVGARGLVAHSADGKKWEKVDIKNVAQPVVNLPDGKQGEWYFGVGNVIPETVKFVANAGGRPVVNEQDYTLYPDEGYIQLTKDLDADPAPSITFSFNPGPAFRAGDVSWNVVLAEGDTITLAGEFGMVLQSTDAGKTWVRRDTILTPKEPEPAYWLTGVHRGETIWLAGAAGVSRSSHDRGVTWTPAPSSGTEGIFGMTLTSGGQPVIAGAVGLIGVLDNDKWKTADRTELNLLSWLKTPVEMPDGTLVVLGGRSTAILYKDGAWKRIPVTVK